MAKVMPLAELQWRERLARKRADKLRELSEEPSEYRREGRLLNLAIRAHTRAEDLAARIARLEEAARG